MTSWNLFIEIQTNCTKLNIHFYEVAHYGILLRDVMRHRTMKENEKFEGILISC
jgi:hypothetical protein